MKILIACEMSGIVRRAFQAKGHKVTSVDLQESEDDSPDHKIGCVRPYLVEPWDLIIAFPPCTYLSKAGLHWNRKRPEWSKEKKRRHKSRFFPGIAAAMASQWESLVCQIPLFGDELVTSSPGP